MAKRDIYKQVAQLRAKHGRDRSLVRGFPDLSTARTAPSLSDGFAPVIDNQARTLGDKFRAEQPQVRRQIQAKANRIRIVVGKSAYQYATDGDDPRSVHRK